MDNFDELKASHEVDQGLAEGIAIGNIRVVGQNESGQDLMTLTSKGVTRVAIQIASHYINTADDEKRDFTPEESHEILGHLVNAIMALQKAEE